MLSERTNATGPRFQKHLRRLQTPSAQCCALIFRTALGALPFHCTKLCKLRTLKILVSWVAIILTDRNEQVMQVLASTIAFGHSWGFASLASKCDSGDREAFSKHILLTLNEQAWAKAIPGRKLRTVWTLVWQKYVQEQLLAGEINVYTVLPCLVNSVTEWLLDWMTKWSKWLADGWSEGSLS